MICMTINETPKLQKYKSRYFDREIFQKEIVHVYINNTLWSLNKDDKLLEIFLLGYSSMDKF